MEFNYLCDTRTPKRNGQPNPHKHEMTNTLWLMALLLEYVLSRKGTNYIKKHV